MSANSHVLLIDCADRKGIVHQVTGVLFRLGLNIEEQGEFVDHLSQHFFLRTAICGEVEAESLLEEIKQVISADAAFRIEEKRKKKIVVLASKEPHCLGDLLIRHHYGELDAKIAAIISNHPDLEDLSRKFSIPFICLPHQNLSREEHESRIQAALREYKPEYLVLAKYMRVLRGEFVNLYPNRIINIHHSFLPAFAGSKPYHQAHQRGVKIIGATAHFVSAELDEGPIIAQAVLPINHSKSPDQLMQAGRDIEKTVLAKALRLVFEGRVFVHQNRTIIFD